MFKRILLIGASRGLGRAIAQHIDVHLGEPEHLVLSSRKKDLLDDLKSKLKAASVEVRVADMARREDQLGLEDIIKNFDLVIYSAGGGPHGEFSRKDWKDHDWALQVGLMGPMALVWAWLRSRKAQDMGRFIIVGSRIAEQSPDPLSSSYAASKHGLMGFVSSLQSELQENQNKVWLFSPGYMDSEMLPLNAKIRHDSSKLMSVETAAQALLRWLKKNEGPWHRVLN